MTLPRPATRPNTAVYQTYPEVPEHTALSVGEWELVRRLMMAPPLWPVQILAGLYGYPQTVAWLHAPATMPEEAMQLLAEGSFKPSDLPPAMQVIAGMWGAILHGTIPRGSKLVPTLENKAAKRGLTMEQAIEADRVMESFIPLARMLALP